MELERPLIVWFRRDLRIADHPALNAAVTKAVAIVPLFILDDTHDWALGAAARWWLHGALADLSAQLEKRGASLILRRGRAEKILLDVAKETGACGVMWNRCYEPAVIARDKAIKSNLQKSGLSAESTNGALLFEPWELKTQAGNPFKVFTPFWRTAMNAPAPPRKPLAAPKKLKGLPQKIASDDLDAWQLLPTKPDWAGGLREAWTPGESAAKEQLATFHDEAVSGYTRARDIPGERGTSRLSPYLAFGEISPHQVWHAANHWEPEAGQAAFMRQIIWREFCTHLLYHFPHMPEQPLRTEFVDFPWAKNTKHLRAWQQGRTGYPIVDAGMRELWHTGWMHNRVRMITASFLVKHLLLPWRAGEDWFWDTLVDADLANNAANWQWVAGCGTDAAPYFRVFNPVLQGEKFDTEGTYVRRWVPELALLNDSWIHKPWEAPDSELKKAGIILGKTYPAPLVDHKTARARALAAFKEIRATDAD